MQRAVMLVVVLWFLVTTLRDFRLRRLSIGDAWLWLLAVVSAALLVAFPELAAELAQALGFNLVSNLVFTIGFVAVAWIIRRQSRRISALQRQLQTVVEELALRNVAAPEEPRT